MHVKNARDLHEAMHVVLAAWEDGSPGQLGWVAWRRAASVAMARGDSEGGGGDSPEARQPFLAERPSPSSSGEGTSEIAAHVADDAPPICSRRRGHVSNLQHDGFPSR